MKPDDREMEQRMLGDLGRGEEPEEADVTDLDLATSAVERAHAASIVLTNLLVKAI